MSTGQQYAVAGRWGDWTANPVPGQKAWFRNPKERPTAVPAAGRVVTPRKGLDSVPVYGRAYPEKAAYPEGVPAQEVSPLPYTLLKGQQYVTGGKVPGEYLYAVTFDRSSHQVVRGQGAVLPDPVRSPGRVRAGGGRDGENRVAAAVPGLQFRPSFLASFPARNEGRSGPVSPAGTVRRAAA
ncbi:hypothetical protein SHIRM173S_08899 [Streptomyces hirsutus]